MNDYVRYDLYLKYKTALHFPQENNYFFQYKVS